MSRSRQHRLPLLAAAFLAIAGALLPGCGGTPAVGLPPAPTLRPTFTPTAPPQPASPVPVLPIAPPAATPLAPAPAPSGAGRIAFVSGRDGNYEIYVMNADGSGQTRLTEDPSDDVSPDWSPDGTRLVFTSHREGNDGIYVVNADGSRLARLIDKGMQGARARWSPDGSRLAFETFRDGNDEIYAMNDNGSDLKRLTDDPADDTQPDWSPDGSRIAFTSERDGNEEIYAMNADGSGQARLTDNPAADTSARWSPDGARIAFVSDRDGAPGLYVMNADGSGQKRFSDDPGVGLDLAWSPDGTRIAFTSYHDDNADLYVMNADGTGQARLTEDPAEEWGPAWSPYSVLPAATPQPPQEVPFVVSGKLRYREQVPVPGDARVVAAWIAGEEAYIFGEGRIDLDSHSFWLELDGPPPPEATHANGASSVGLAVLLLTADETLRTGASFDQSGEAALLGGAEQYAIVYLRGSPETEDAPGWLRTLRQGYSAVRRISVADDEAGYAPVDPRNIEIVIDRHEDLDL